MEKKLEEKLRYWNEAYRIGEPIVPDNIYDEELEKLKRFYPNNSFLKEIGYLEENSNRKEKLPKYMASLNKEKTLLSVKNWLQVNEIKHDTQLLLTPKLDGISLISNNNKWWTRGNGELGQNSTEYCKNINKYSFNFKNVVGEAIISKSNWDKYFKGKIDKYSGKPYVSARNTVAGLFNRDFISEELKYIDFIPYGYDSEDDISQSTKLYNLKTNGINIPFKLVFINDLTEQLLNQLYEEWNKVYQIDGIVIDIDNKGLRKKLGFLENNNPAYARAIKFPYWTETVQTKIIDFNFNISKQGKLKGTVVIEPVIIDGVKINQATFYNAKFLIMWGVMPGEIVSIKRSGDVIPKITGISNIHIPLREEFESSSGYVVEHSKSFRKRQNQLLNNIKYSGFINTITNCPKCGDKMSWDENKVELICNNKKCPGIIISKLVHFFKAIGIEEFGEPSIIQFYKLGYHSIKSILELTVKEISKFDGWGEKSAKKLVKEFNKLKTKGVSLSKFMYALDLFEGKLGEKIAQNIFDNLMKDQDILPLFTFKDLLIINGVNEITAKYFFKAYKEKFYLEDWSDFPVKISYIKTPEQMIKGNKYEDEYICMTGFRDDKLSSYIESEGGVIVNNVTKKTTILIVKDLNSNSSKMKKAKEFNIKIIQKSNF